jgi:hypothetical protein
VPWQTPEDYETTERVIRSYPPFRKAVMAAGFDPDRVMIDPWSCGACRGVDPPTIVQHGHTCMGGGHMHAGQARPPTTDRPPDGLTPRTLCVCVCVCMCAGRVLLQATSALTTTPAGA